MHNPQAILFDLDGTLADTAPDLAAAINVMRERRDLPPAHYQSLRPHASAGARGLLAAGFQLTPDDPTYEAMRMEFLDQYAASIAEHSQLFEHIPALLHGLDSLGIAWGIVTNKAMRFTQPLIPLLELEQARCVISGDTTAHPKPHPAPLFEAARQLGIAAKDCWYVGDDLRDIEAAAAAEMTSIAAAWGYCGATTPRQWNADAIVDSPLELLELIRAKHEQACEAESNNTVDKIALY
ncbi:MULTISPECIES: HAD-IA family hydrolase [unclassified Undibacterium]|uniref:HAD family hydrolase n=1 Tax=unclassified Undibacterium TaxID=2630295 RepID=UPI002AC8AA2C|nr:MULTISPECIES: HAD-IA family hydrolase [unclassified Undibacterium]MEB0139549.1 HAD-IA family hydrolase [Undibacterium sp. CCC2.1]MEB0172520.1 HAD-IA family hydrolase [Undibacterium sp. CCC1.1]MEB0176538.1 HAD-IA family hydrolase [Undibacterium sp. CCC3.4]MEB0215608.1 HAD-IA family hydrolase [Undibacterium sp. 5I2]WPX43993.1 HAD-IA family hydrolase [Undibacterium sp. CCC3.4]